MLKHLAGYAVTFFIACLLIYYGIQLLTEIWWILLIIAGIITAIVIYFHARKNRPKW